MVIVEQQDWTFHDPLVLLGFPSQGLVGAIAAGYLVPKLDMELVATMDSDVLPPVCSTRNGRALAPVQAYATTYRCGLDGECDQLVVVRGDTLADSKHARALADELLEWIDGFGASSLVCLEGAGESLPEGVFGVQNFAGDLALDELEVEPVRDGGMGGLAAPLLVGADRTGLPAAALFTSADPDMPDARAAARLIGPVDHLVPGIRMEPEALLERARVVEDRLRDGMADQQEALDRIEDVSAIMYR